MTKAKTRPTRKPTSNREFDRRHKILQLVLPIIGSLLAAAIGFWGGISSAKVSKVEYKVSPSDQAEINKLAYDIEVLMQEYIANSDQAKRGELNIKLMNVARAEAAIMKKYNPDYRPRWSKSLYITQLPIEPRNVIEESPSNQH